VDVSHAEGSSLPFGGDARECGYAARQRSSAVAGRPATISARWYYWRRDGPSMGQASPRKARPECLLAGLLFQRMCRGSFV